MAFSITPIAGIDLSARSSSAKFGLTTAVLASDGHKYVYCKASEALASTSSINIRANGSASSKTTGSGATYDTGATGNGGVTTAIPYFWGRQTAI